MWTAQVGVGLLCELWSNYSASIFCLWNTWSVLVKRPPSFRFQHIADGSRLLITNVWPMFPLVHALFMWCSPAACTEIFFQYFTDLSDYCAKLKWVLTLATMRWQRRWGVFNEIFLVEAPFGWPLFWTESVDINVHGEEARSLCSCVPCVISCYLWYNVFAHLDFIGCCWNVMTPSQ